MRIKRKLFSATLLLTMVCVSISGCGNSNEVDEIESIMQINTIAASENGWTDKMINSVLYVDGKPFSMPIYLDDFSGFEWDIENEYY